MEREHRVKKRAQRACAKCREDKVKCTGSFPCQRCVKRKLICNLDNGLREAGTAKRYLRKLESRATTTVEQQELPLKETHTRISNRPETPQWLNASDEGAGSELIQEPERFAHIPISTSHHPVSLRKSPEVSIRNPLAVDCSNYFPNASGRPIHLGTSSNWSFGRRVLVMSYEKAKHAPLPADYLHFDGTSYDLGWDEKRHPPFLTDHETTVMPSADYAMHLINVVKFHCGQLFHLFEEEKFMQKFHLHHKNELNQPGLWYVHYLFILAFGKAFVVQASKERKPAGAEFFSLAMKLLPALYYVVGDYIELVQIICCAALYLHCTDFRGAAYRMVGQALRVALEDGMHTEMHSQDINNVYAQRCRRVWWTVYILDRQMSSLMGVPIAISDESIHAALPTFPGEPQRSEAMGIHIKLSRVLGHILNSVYGEEGRSGKQFLRTTRDALRRIADVTDQLNASFEIPQNGSTQGISRLSASLHLLHHQCIILTTRPLLYSLLQARIGQSDINLVHTLQSGSVRALLLMCIDFAQQIMDILVTLHIQSLLESFLRSDLDAAFTAMITLLMAPVIDMSLLKGSSPWLRRGYAVLDDMISRGNMVALQMKSELRQLEDVFNCLNVGELGSNKRHQHPAPYGQLSKQDQCLQASTGASSTSPPMTPMDISPTLRNNLQLDESLWEDGFTTEQLINFANSIDINSLDFL
ncbi:Zn(II)2Cys6 transcription factor [Fusarium oxysporum]|nr:Zn(II)2Cys6 transcription factor [Fusarium oxysporum]